MHNQTIPEYQGNKSRQTTTFEILIHVSNLNRAKPIDDSPNQFGIYRSYTEGNKVSEHNWFLEGIFQ